MNSVPAVATQQVTRRDFLRLVGWGSFVAVLSGAGLSTLRFLVPNVLYEPPSRFKIGLPDDYPVNTVSTKWLRQHRVWIVRTPDGLYAFWARCTHLGCTPNWFDQEQRFRCPCHGSNFNMQGDVLAGPAPKPLFRVAIGLADDGQIMIDKARLENRPGPRDQGEFFLSYKG